MINKKYLLASPCSSGKEKVQPEVFDFDHVYPGSEDGESVAILYGAIGTPCFERLHTLLADACKDVSRILNTCKWGISFECSLRIFNLVKEEPWLLG